MVMASTNMDSKLYENRNILKNPGVDNRYAVKKIKQDFSNLGNGEGVSRLSPPLPNKKFLFPLQKNLTIQFQEKTKTGCRKNLFHRILLATVSGLTSTTRVDWHLKVNIYSTMFV